MSGLIWSGIGQGIANAGQTVGNFMMKDIEYQRQLQAEDRKEANYLKRLEEAQRIKDEAAEAKAEALQQRVSQETAAAQAAGAEAPGARMAGQLKTLQGQIAGESPAMSEAEIQQLIKENPQYKKVYEEAGYVTKRDERRERAEGAIAAAMKAGAHSTTKKDLGALRDAVIKEIESEFKERKEEKRADEMNERLELLAQDVKTRERNADTYANRPTGGGGKGGGGGDNLTLQSIKANLASADKDIKSVDDRIKTLESQKKDQSRAEKEATDEKIAKLVLNKENLSKRKTEYQTQLGNFTSARTGTAAPAAAATGNRPALSTFGK